LAVAGDCTGGRQDQDYSGNCDDHYFQALLGQPRTRGRYPVVRRPRPMMGIVTLIASILGLPI